MPTVLLFVDNSNIFISAKDEAFRREGRSAKDQVRLQFDLLLQLALAGRPLARAFVVGSIPPEQRVVWERLERATGVKPELYERGGLSGGEQGLDQCLQVHMLRAISDYRDPQVAVLMTGDGAGYDDGVGFHADLERMHAAGWGIEVLSWLKSCRRTLREWATTNGKFIPLDDYYESVTFLEGGRHSIGYLAPGTVNSSSQPSASSRTGREGRVRSQGPRIAARTGSAEVQGGCKFQGQGQVRKTDGQRQMRPIHALKLTAQA